MHSTTWTKVNSSGFIPSWTPVVQKVILLAFNCPVPPGAIAASTSASTHGHGFHLSRSPECLLSALMLKSRYFASTYSQKSELSQSHHLCISPSPTCLQQTKHRSELARNGTKSSTYTIIIKMTIHWRQLQYEVSNKLSLSIEQTIYKEKEMQKAGGDKYLAYMEMEPRIKLHNPMESIPKWAKSASIEVPILDSRAEYYCGTRIHSFSIKVVKRSK